MDKEVDDGLGKYKAMSFRGNRHKVELQERKSTKIRVKNDQLLGVITDSVRNPEIKTIKRILAKMKRGYVRKSVTIEKRLTQIEILEQHSHRPLHRPN